MKKSFISVFLIALTALLYSTAATAQDSLKIEGVIFHGSKEVNNVDVSIFRDNTSIKEFEVRGKNKVVTNIPLYEIITVEFNSPGYYTKRVMFDTNVPDDAKTRNLTYTFDVDLYSLEEIQGMNISELDFPIGLVKYNKNKFDENTPYTRRKKIEHIDMLKKTRAADSKNSKGKK